MRIESTAATHVGQLRDTNEDAILVDDSMGLFIVCDGMGGHAAGEIASDRSITFAAEHIRQRQSLLTDVVNSGDGYDAVVELVVAAIRDASSKLYQIACAEAECRGMGTTMTLILVVGQKAIMGHVGDSRLYMLRGNEVHQLSTDHTLGNELRVEGGLADDDIIVHKYRNVLTRVIGSQDAVQVETLMFDILPDDILLLCSDGLSNYFTTPSQIRPLLATRNIQDSASRLVSFANAAGGADNISTIVLRAIRSEQSTGDEHDVGRRLDALAASFLCRGVRKNRIMRLLNISTTERFSAGQTVVSRDDRDKGLFIVLSGTVLVTLPWANQRTVPRHGCFAQSSLAADGRVIETATVGEDAELLCISRREFHRLTRRVPRFGRLLLKNLADELCRNLCETSFMPDEKLSDTSEWSPDEWK